MSGGTEGILKSFRKTESALHMILTLSPTFIMDNPSYTSPLKVDLIMGSFIGYPSFLLSKSTVSPSVYDIERVTKSPSLGVASPVPWLWYL